MILLFSDNKLHAETDYSNIIEYIIQLFISDFYHILHLLNYTACAGVRSGPFQMWKNTG